MTVIIQWKISVCDPFLSLETLGFSLFSHTGDHWLWTLVVDGSLALGNGERADLTSTLNTCAALSQKIKAAQKSWGERTVLLLFKLDWYFRAIHMHFGDSQKVALLGQLTFKSSCFWSLSLKAVLFSLNIPIENWSYSQCKVWIYVTQDH